MRFGLLHERLLDITRLLSPPTVATERLVGVPTLPYHLLDYGFTFAADLTEAAGRKIPISEASQGSPSEVFLTLSSPKAFHDAAGRPTSEGYTLHVNTHTITIVGASPLGIWWEQDAPGWKTRGILLDAGRHYHPPQFLIETCAYLSFFKQNMLHLHLSDNMLNLSPPTSKSQLYDSYAAFRLSSNDPQLAGLAKPSNETYTKDQFDLIQRRCAARGVTIILELEASAHALPIVVHIGADEYSSSSFTDSQVVSDYTRLVNELSLMIKRLSGKSVRLWGTFPPSRGAVIDKSISIQHWTFNETNPMFDLIANGYQVLNSDEMFYLVGKIQVVYGITVNLTRVFHGLPNASNNTPRDNSALLGRIAALWNDFGPNATTYSEAYYTLRDGLPTLADKQWGGSLLQNEYESVLPILPANIPGQNLDRKIASVTCEFSNFNFTYAQALGPQKNEWTTIKDKSGNTYDAITNCRLNDALVLERGCVLDTPLCSKGRNFTLTFAVKMSSIAGWLVFTGADSHSRLEKDKTTLVSGGNEYFVNYSFSVGVWTQASLIRAGERTLLKVDNGSTYEFLADVGLYGVQKRTAPIAIEAPLACIGGGSGSGQIHSLVLNTNIA
ncbi:glycoside hydrolase family 20 protein [Macroventuria anomochaeta]|uniref:Glycoside hydrolase family 20 protein n=1 Tax=Macroventuria anomochaeta TaxID=301207 RepID=A0ACB6RIU3_9PLEO|nr:glycoside hydrolase family 20 protein [Macroventuria anomochaeta]KAF2621074.1 glycoside hydrolase family 20 protein [Macroventuria anomochaeta]